jgi:glycosyltransferase involved in cell wall biosynthesis
MTRHLVRKAKKSIIERFIYRNIDKIIFVSNLAKDAFLSTSPEIDLTKCLVIHNGVKDHSNSNAKNLRKEYSIPDDEMILMYHGRITHEKGVEVIIKALGKLPDDIRCRLFIIGSGDNDYIAKLKTEAQAANIANKIEWIGFQSDVIPWIKGTDCGIIPTIAQESFGLSVAEYMMAGKAVITTNNGAQKEFIKDKETGLLIPPDDAEALTRSIAYVYNNSYGKEIGRQALAYYKDNLSFDIFYAKLKKIYEE